MLRSFFLHDVYNSETKENHMNTNKAQQNVECKLFCQASEDLQASINEDLQHKDKPLGELLAEEKDASKDNEQPDC